MVNTQLSHSCNMGSIPIIDANRCGAMASTRGFQSRNLGSIPSIGAKLTKRTYSIVVCMRVCLMRGLGSFPSASA